MFGWFTTEPVNSTSKTWNFIIGCILLPCLLTLRQCHICFAQQNISVDREIPLYNRNRNFTTSPKNHLNSKKKNIPRHSLESSRRLPSGRCVHMPRRPCSPSWPRVSSKHRQLGTWKSREAPGEKVINMGISPAKMVTSPRKPAVYDDLTWFNQLSMVGFVG